ncbi:MAG: hypothetical protein AB7F96_16455 [Beijerinckiaceae bacterium]
MAYQHNPTFPIRMSIFGDMARWNEIKATIQQANEEFKEGENASCAVSLMTVSRLFAHLSRDLQARGVRKANLKVLEEICDMQFDLSKKILSNKIDVKKANAVSSAASKALRAKAMHMRAGRSRAA